MDATETEAAAAKSEPRAKPTGDPLSEAVAPASSASRTLSPDFRIQMEPGTADGEGLGNSDGPVNVIQNVKSQARKVFSAPSVTLIEMAGEFIGTLFLTLIVITAIGSSIVTGAQIGIWQVAFSCGIGVALSIYCTSHISDAHLNPAITLAFAIVRWKVFSWKKAIPYMTAQLLGGIAAGCINYGVHRHAIARYETLNGIVRGENGSEITASMFGEYFPNPALFDLSLSEDLEVISPIEAMMIEVLITGILALVVFSLTCPENTTVGSGNNKVVVPLMIGLTVAIMVNIFGALTMSALNPARDFGPRIVAVFAGWWRIAIPGPRNGFWVYIVGPMLGATLFAAVYDHLVARGVRLTKANRKRKSLARQYRHRQQEAVNPTFFRGQRNSIPASELDLSTDNDSKTNELWVTTV